MEISGESDSVRPAASIVGKKKMTEQLLDRLNLSKEELIELMKAIQMKGIIVFLINKNKKKFVFELIAF
jgi:translation elongation factor EF-4